MPGGRRDAGRPGGSGNGRPPGRPRRSGVRRLGRGWRFGVIIVVALGVLVGDGWWLLRTKAADKPQPPRAETAEAVSQAAALTSARATFSTQLAGITTVFGRVSEQLRPQRTTLTMTTIDGADRFGVTEVVTDSAVFLRAPGLANSVGRPWISVPVAGLTADPALTELYQTGAIPTLDAALIGKAAGVRSTGPQTVNGVRTTRYVGIIEPAQALRRLSPAERQLLAPELTAVSGEMSFVAWIDAHHNLVKLQTSATIDGVSTVTTVVVTAFNERMHLTVPARSQVSAVTASDLRTTSNG
jgi:hypothetical protein